MLHPPFSVPIQILQICVITLRTSIMETILNLPVEVLSAIISRLDPATLISLSQSSQLLRRLVNPTRHDFERRLLALELTHEFGGIVPKIINISNFRRVTTPPREDDEWKNNKYACLGCMKLLPHYMFSEHAVFSLEYAKPLPETAEAQKSQVTDWQPLSTDRKRKRIKDDHEAQRMKRLRLIQPHTTSGHVSAEAQTELVGMWRHKRRCHECKYQTERTRNANISTDRIPTVSIGKITYMQDQAGLQRFFPGLLDTSAMGCATNDRIMAMARCPCCETWQEHRAFGKNFFITRLCRIPPNWVCYRCYVATALKGQPPCYIAQRLCWPVLTSLLDPYGHDRTVFFDGWFRVQIHVGPGGILKRHGFFPSEDWPRAFEVLRNHASNRVVSVKLLQTLRPLFDEYRSALKDRPSTSRGHGNHHWIAGYDKLETKIYSMLQQIEIIKRVCDQKPQFIIDYFTKQDDPFYWGAEYTIMEEFQLMEDGTVARKVNGRL